MNENKQQAPHRTSSPVGERLRAAVGMMLSCRHLPFYLLLAFVMTVLVECLARHSVIGGLTFIFISPLAFLTNYGIILLTLLPALLFRRRLAATILLSLPWLTLAITDFVLLLFRVTPLSAVDLTLITSVASIITVYLKVWQVVLVVALLVGAVAGVVFLFIKSPRFDRRLKLFAIAYPSAVAALVLTIIGGFAVGQLSDRFPNLTNAYSDYGFTYCFSMSVVDKGVDKPEGYDSGAITDILDDLIPEDPTPDTTPNVIFVQMESFFDPNYLEGVTFSENPTPNFTAIKEQFPSGALYIPVIGAGTVNTEFEILTGMNVNHFGAGEYPYRSIIAKKTCETIAYDLLASGYRTHAIHNHEGNFYDRNEVYAHLGFENFTSLEYFLNPTFNVNGWAQDVILTDEILHRLTSTAERDFVFTVSVQGHGRYPDEYVPEEGDVVVTDGIEDEIVLSHYNYLIKQFSEMDTFIGDLYEAVMAYGEPTVLVFYGDHLPSIARDEGIVLQTGEYETEYVMVSNFDLPTEGTPVGGPLYAYQVFPAVLEAIGNTEGVMNRFHRTYRDSEEYQELLQQLEYNVLYDDCSAYDHPYEPTDMVMGGRRISITGCSTDEEYLYVTGENFTPYSSVVIDGRKRKTEFIDNSTLRVSLNLTDSLAKLETVLVRQLTVKGEFLSECEPYTILHEDGA